MYKILLMYFFLFRCFSWLERNLLLCRTSALAKYLSEELLKLLLMSKHFVVMQVEMDIYNFLKIWLYLQLHPTCELPLKKLVGETQKFFHEQKNKNHTEFLSCPMGSKFVDVFKCLRVQNMVGDIKCIKLLEKDFIIPKGIVMFKISVLFFLVFVFLIIFTKLFIVFFFALLNISFLAPTTISLGNMCFLILGIHLTMETLKK